MKNFIRIKQEPESEILLINVNEISAINFTSYSSWIYMKSGESHYVYDTPEELFEKIKRATGEIKS